MGVSSFHYSPWTCFCFLFSSRDKIIPFCSKTLTGETPSDFSRVDQDLPLFFLNFTRPSFPLRSISRRWKWHFSPILNTTAAILTCPQTPVSLRDINAVAKMAAQRRFQNQGHCQGYCQQWAPPLTTVLWFLKRETLSSTGQSIAAAEKKQFPRLGMTNTWSFYWHFSNQTLSWMLLYPHFAEMLNNLA